MEELPSLNLTSWGHGKTLGTPRGRGRGRGLHRYTSLDSHDHEAGDEVPLMSPVGVGGGEEGGGESSEEEEEDLLEESSTVRRRRWQQRIKTHSGLIGWFFDRGWQLLLSK